jgi:hypothetical protein
MSAGYDTEEPPAYSQTDRIGKVDKAAVGQDPGRTETRDDNLFISNRPPKPRENSS